MTQGGAVMYKLAVASCMSLVLLTCSGSGGGGEGQQDILKQTSLDSSTVGCCGCCGRCETTMPNVLPADGPPCCCNPQQVLRASHARGDCGIRECGGAGCKGNTATCGMPGSCKPK